jgi:hypothetical protein
VTTPSSLIGASEPRPDALGKVTGAARYPADLVRPTCCASRSSLPDAHAHPLARSQPPCASRRRRRPHRRDVLQRLRPDRRGINPSLRRGRAPRRQGRAGRPRRRPRAGAKLSSRVRRPAGRRSPRRAGPDAPLVHGNLAEPAAVYPHPQGRQMWLRRGRCIQGARDLVAGARLPAPEAGVAW